MNRTCLFLICFLILLLWSSLGNADDSQWSAVAVYKHQFSSKELGQDLRLTISLPSTYGSSDERFGVVYYLDPFIQGGTIREIVHMLAGSQELPQLITVGIGPEVDSVPAWYRQRVFLFTPTQSDTYLDYGVQRSWGGGSREFLRSIEDEIIPLVDKNYRTRKGERTLFGHSLGGLFAFFTLLEKTNLFQGYVISDPSMKWDNSLLERLEHEYATRNDAMSARVFISVSRGTVDEDDPDALLTVSLSRMMEERNYQGLAISRRILEDETHASVVPTAFTKGLRFIYSNAH